MSYLELIGPFYVFLGLLKAYLRPFCKQDQTGLDRSARYTLDFGARYQGIKVSRSQGECSDGCDRGDGATSVTELKVNVICEAGEVI